MAIDMLVSLKVALLASRGSVAPRLIECGKLTVHVLVYRLTSPCLNCPSSTVDMSSSRFRVEVRLGVEIKFGSRRLSREISQRPSNLIH